MPSQDKTADDTAHRLRQVIELAQTVGNRSMRELVKRMNLGGFGAEDVVLVGFNPMPYPRREVVEAWVDMPDRKRRNPFWSAYAPAEGIQVFDAHGGPVGTQWQGRTDETCCVSELHTALRNRPFFAPFRRRVGRD